MSGSLQPQVLLPTRLLCTWGFLGKNTGVSCHFLLWGIFLTQGSDPNHLHWKADSLLLNHQESSKGRKKLGSTAFWPLFIEKEPKAASIFGAGSLLLLLIWLLSTVKSWHCSERWESWFTEVYIKEQTKGLINSPPFPLNWCSFQSERQCWVPGGHQVQNDAQLDALGRVLFCTE